MNQLVSEKLVASTRLAIWLLVLQNAYICLPHIMATRTAGINKNEEITWLSTDVYYRFLQIRFLCKHWNCGNV